MNNMVYIGSAGSKNPGITCLIRCAIFNLEENSSWEGIDYVKNAWFDEDGISVEIDQDGWDEKMSDEEFAELPVDLINQLIREIPKDISGIMRNSDKPTEEEKIEELEDIINNSEETTVKGGGNFEYGDEKIALRLLRQAKARYFAKGTELGDVGPIESMKFGEAKRILEENAIEIVRIDESLEDSSNFESAYEIRHLVKGSEETPKGFEQLYRIYWDEIGKLDDMGIIDIGKIPECLKKLEPQENSTFYHEKDWSRQDDVKWVTKKLWYRVAEYMIKNGNSPCSVEQIKRGIGITGYQESFRRMRREGFFDVLSMTKIVLSDWAAEKYYAAKEHAEEDYARLEKKAIKKYGTLEKQIADHEADVAMIKKAFSDYMESYEQRRKAKRKQDVTDYFDKRRS